MSEGLANVFMFVNAMFYKRYHDEKKVL